MVDTPETPTEEEAAEEKEKASNAEEEPPKEPSWFDNFKERNPTFNKVWSTLTYPAKKWKELDTWFQGFKEEHPTFKKVWNFLTHPTMVRVYSLAAAIAAAPLTGGFSLVFAIKIAIVFSASLISVVAKAFQLRRLEKLKFQKNLLQTTTDKLQATTKLLKAKGYDQKLLSTLGITTDTPPHQIQNANYPSKARAALKTIRDLVLESSVAAGLMAFATGPLGFVGYSLALAFGITSISKEYDERRAADFEKDKVKQLINKLSKDGHIPPYKNLKELDGFFQKKMVELTALEKTLEQTEPGTDPEKIKARYEEIKKELDKQLPLYETPVKPNIFKSLWHAVRPWGKQGKTYETPEYDNISQKLNVQLPSSLQKPITSSRDPQVQAPGHKLGIAAERKTLEQGR